MYICFEKQRFKMSVMFSFIFLADIKIIFGYNVGVLSIKKEISNIKADIRKNIFACLFSVHNTISLSRHEQVCLMRLRFERYFSHHRAM